MSIGIVWLIRIVSLVILAIATICGVIKLDELFWGRGDWIKLMAIPVGIALFVLVVYITGAQGRIDKQFAQYFKDYIQENIDLPVSVKAEIQKKHGRRIRFGRQF